MPSAFSTRAKPGFRSPSSRGQRDAVSATISARVPGRTEGLSPAFRAARAHLGLVAGLFVLAGVGWWGTVEEMKGMDNGPWSDLGALGGFLGVGVVMVGAVMLPSVSPAVALYSRMTRGGGRPPPGPV